MKKLIGSLIGLLVIFGIPVESAHAAACSPTSSTTSGVTLLTFTTTGDCTWDIPTGVRYLNVFVVGAGGGGGGSYDNGAGGGGGGGQVVAQTIVDIGNADTATITVGTGGTAGYGARTAAPYEYDGLAGGNSVILFGTDSITALGGGGGSKSRNDVLNRTVGTPGNAATATTAAQGGALGGASAGNYGGGGGGSQAAGITKNGGNGTSSNFSGSATTYGTGGAGGNAQTASTGATGTANRGNGGGGASSIASSNGSGGAGGSGIVYIKYATTGATISQISVSGIVNKGNTSTLTATLNSVGKVRFFANGKRIPNCLSVATSGSGPTYTASCNWKATNTGSTRISVQFYPTDANYLGALSADFNFTVSKRSNTR